MSKEETTKIVNIDKAEDKAQDNDLLVKLTRTYNFEGKEISEVDLSGMDDLTANDMIRANKVLQNSGTISAVPETNLEYAMIIAASATGTPVEFFKGLKPRDAIKIKTKVTSFFFGEEYTPILSDPI